MAARESGTIDGTALTTVTGQTGRLEKIVEWVQSAWLQIQNKRNSWRWMRAEFSGTITLAGGTRYTAAASFSLTRWAEWITEIESLTIYKNSIGLSDEGPITFIDNFTTWRKMYERGLQTANSPTHYAVSPTGELCFGSTPDEDHVVRGDYRKSPQTLVANTDIPEMPVRFHEVIAWYALVLLAEHDEAEFDVGKAFRNYTLMMGQLERDQLAIVRDTSISIGTEG